MSDDNFPAGRGPLLAALSRLLDVCGVAAETGTPSQVAIQAALDEVRAAGADLPGPLGIAAVILGESFVALAGRCGPEALAALVDAQAILDATLAAERARALDEAHRLTGD